MILNGLISTGGEYDSLYIGNDILSAECEDFDNKIVRLNYYLSNQPIDPTKVVEEMLRTFYEGSTEADSTYMYGTTWTGCYGRHDQLEIGGHDIIAELSEHIGKYCYLIVELFT